MRTYARRPAAERFWEKVEKTDTCWVWTGASRPSGYGNFMYEPGRLIQPHWFLLDRWPEKGEIACHTCDNPRCVRPDHIFIGTPSQNSADMKAKGRANWREGDECTYSKITAEQAVLIKACPRIKGAMAKMCRSVGITDQTGVMIRNGTRWRHLPDPTPDDFRRAQEFLDSLP